MKILLILFILFSQIVFGQTKQCDLLIITKNKFVNSFSTLAKFKELQGYYTKIETVENITANYMGSDIQDKIRNCIKYYYAVENTRYVILGGTSLPSVPDKDVIPHRGFYCSGGEHTDWDIPADIYYSNLNGDWVLPNDTTWGRVGTEDFTPEVAVGRLPIVDDDDILNITNKLILYQNSPVISDIKKIGFYGGLLTWNETAWGRTSMNNLISTVPIPTSNIFYKLYDSTNKFITTEQMQNLFNNVGVGIVTSLGHAGFSGDLKINGLYNNQGIKFLTNDGIRKMYPVIISQGCYAGALDIRSGEFKYYADSYTNFYRTIAGQFLTTKYGGAVAYVCNSRYGYFNYIDNGATQQFHREIFRALYINNITKIGDALNYAKYTIAFNSPSLSGNLRFVYYDINLFGDPSMDVWTEIPTNIIATYENTLSTKDTMLMINTNTPNARVALSFNDKLLGRSITNETGQAIIIFQPTNIIGTAKLSIIAHNKNRYQSNIQIINKSGTIRGAVSYTNTSNTPLVGVQVMITSENKTYLTTTDSKGNYEINNIPFGDYIVTATSNNPVGSINSVDSQLILENFVQIKPLSGLKLLAGDVNGSGYVNSLDAMLVAEYFVGIIDSFSVGKWIFDVKMVNLQIQNKIVMFKGIAYGDVNGSFIPY